MIPSKKIALLLPGIDDSSSLSQHMNSSTSVNPEKVPPQKNHEPIINKIPKIDHGGSYLTVSDKPHNQTVNEHIEDNEASSYDFFQQAKRGKRYCKSICLKFIFNIKWLDLQIISYQSTIPIWSSRMNKQLKCYQLRNIISFT